ncbi:Glu-tRNA(Gln) amidotransferase subunit GatD [Candidatus Micrarchaeota archaeon]|nr:Glu-tRNA(Gln) amidotransferase subunit GatD [Candidatus Micrarchaeota archaeon]
MYSSKILAVLKKAGVEIGDIIRVNSGNEEYLGILMPRAGESDDLVIKLESGYNIGIGSEDAKIELKEKAKKKKEEKEDVQKRGEVAILGAGGTILSKVEYTTGATFPISNPNDIAAAFPKIKEIASFHSKILFQLFSEDFTPEHWKMIAKSVAEEIKEGAKGVVIMHGTDTLHYTSAALSFALQNLPVPLVLVGSQRSSDRPSSDNESNLLNAVFLAKSDIAHVGVCMHANSNDSFANFHLGTKARKMHSSRRDAFQSINSLPLARADYQSKKIEPLIPYTKRDEKRKLEMHNHFSSNVAMIYAHPGIKPELIDKLSDYDGVVFVGTGLCNIPTNPMNDKFANNILPNAKALVDSGIPVVMSTQTIYGRVNMNVYSAGRKIQEAGIIGNGADWTPETAYVKLCWVLGKEKRMEKVRELMMKNVAGEITERTNYDEKIVDF